MDLLLAALQRRKRPGESSRAGSDSSVSSTASFKTARSSRSRAAGERPESESSFSDSDSEGSEGGQGYRRKVTEVFEDFKMLPLCLQKLEMEKQQGKWEKTQGGSSGMAPKAKSGATNQALDLIDGPFRSEDASASEEPTQLAFYESPFVSVGSMSNPRIDLRNPLLIDPWATTIPAQPPKIMMIRELAQLYHMSNTEDMERDTWSRGGFVGERSHQRFMREMADRAAGTQGGSGSTDPIPFPPAPDAISPALTAAPQPQFKFLDLVRAASPENLPASTTIRPFDWAPMPAGALSQQETLPAIFWSVSTTEPVSVVFYLFPTPRNINHPVSVGMVGDESVPNIGVHPMRRMSEAFKKASWSGYIDLSRPMVIPNAAIYSSPSLARTDEERFWGVWKCFFKRPAFGGRQYGMTKETGSFENPVRLRRAFESSPSRAGGYTAQMALEKPPLRLKSTATDESGSDDETVKGYDPEDGAQSDDDSMTVGRNEEAGDNFSDSDSNDIFTDAVSTPIKESFEEKPVTNWLEAMFERPSAITLDENVKIDTQGPEKPMIEVIPQCNPQTLEEVQVEEEGRVIEKGSVFENPEQYKELNIGQNVTEVQEPEELSTFDKLILRLINLTIAPQGWIHPVPSIHTPYQYGYTGPQNTKAFLDFYKKLCVKEAQEAEIREKGFTEIPDGPYPWDNQVHTNRMEKQFVISEVIRGFKKAYGVPPYMDRYVNRHYKMAVQAKKHGRFTMPAPWVPEPVIEALEKGKVKRVTPPGFGSFKFAADSSSSSDEEPLNKTKSAPRRSAVEELRSHLTASQGKAHGSKQRKPAAKPKLVMGSNNECLSEGSSDEETKPQKTLKKKNRDSKQGKSTVKPKLVMGSNNECLSEGSSDEEVKPQKASKKKKRDSKQRKTTVKPKLVMSSDNQCLSEGSSDEEKPNIAAASSKPKSPFFTERFADDDDPSETVEGTGMEHFGKPLFAPTLSAKDPDDDMRKLKSLWLTDDDSDEEDTTKNPSAKFPWFTECSANDDSDEQGVKTTKIPVAKSPWFTERNANDDSDEKGVKDTKSPVMKSPLFTKGSANDDSDEDATQKPIPQEDAPKPSLSALHDKEEDVKNTTTPKSTWFTEYNADDEDNGRTQDLVANNNAYDNEARSSSAPKPLSRELSAPPSNDQHSSPSPGSTLATPPVELRSSKVLSRAELRAMRRARTGQTSGPMRSLGSIFEERAGPSNLQPQEEERKSIKKPGKIRIPDVFLGDQATAPGAPLPNFGQAAPPQENVRPLQSSRPTLSTIDESDASETATSEHSNRSSQVQPTEGESDWSTDMRGEALKRRYESHRPRSDRPF
ncbi:hypothetical protein TWF481_002286 [Arthrobotrys musiformis]|uniref:Uncharacterized protein n=1 Tax=Arthrobotrys musiformis TaxID=47236 RepID=A0AAV9VSR2_9PEZI